MARLYLLRHAKARAAPPGGRDIDRGLDDRGRADADALGRAMAERGYVPDLVLCSEARRARDTWEGVRKGFAVAPSVTFTAELYGSGGTTYLDLVRQAAAKGSVLVVGHNPMIEDAALAVAPSAAMKEALARGFPTAGLAAIDFEGPVADVGPGSGTLVGFLAPGRL